MSRRPGVPVLLGQAGGHDRVTHITKQFVVTDPRGRVVQRSLERLVDSPWGTQVIRATSGSRCAGCWRVVTDASELTGLCGWCGRGPLCRACEVSCCACGRKVCGRCRHGFVWGRVPVATCPRCYRLLNRRAVYEHRMAARKLSFALGLQARQHQLREKALRMQLLRLGPAIGRSVARGGR